MQQNNSNPLSSTITKLTVSKCACSQVVVRHPITTLFWLRFLLFILVHSRRVLHEKNDHSHLLLRISAKKESFLAALTMQWECVCVHAHLTAYTLINTLPCCCYSYEKLGLHTLLSTVIIIKALPPPPAACLFKIILSHAHNMGLNFIWEENYLRILNNFPNSLTIITTTAQGWP